MQVQATGNGRAALVLAAATLASQANALGAWFVGDDFDFLRFIGRLDGPADVLAISFWGEWEPLWYLSWYADMRLWGMSPVGFHLTNTAWLYVGVFALYALVRQLLPESPWPAWAASLIFLVHPIHDEAVVYLAARGHPMALGLCLVACWLWVLSRDPGSDRRSRWALAGGALTAAFLAGLAKELALVLPAWIWVLEWWTRRELPWKRGLASASLAAALFAVPGLAVLGWRHQVVGLESPKLTGALSDPWQVVTALVEDTPSYALLGTLPLPFAFADYPALERARPLGWAIALVGAVLLGAGFVRAARLRAPPGPMLTAAGLGTVIFVTALLPVVWADLSLRRRYLYTPSAGLAIVAAVIFEHFRRRYPRAAPAALALLLLAGSGATLFRNELYRQSGDVTRSLMGALRKSAAESGGAGPVVLTTLPRSWGGDFLSGAYLLHHTDVGSMMRLAGFEDDSPQYALACSHAEDYPARLRTEPDGTLLLEVRFRSDRAYRDAEARDLDDDRRGDSLRATLISRDPHSHALTYRLDSDGPPPPRLLVYADGRFSSVAPRMEPP